jgi:hypothetical protein
LPQFKDSGWFSLQEKKGRDYQVVVDADALTLLVVPAVANPPIPHAGPAFVSSGPGIVIAAHHARNRLKTEQFLRSK